MAEVSRVRGRRTIRGSRTVRRHRPGTARKGVTTAMEMQGTPFLPEEEAAADAMAVTLLNAADASSCHALIGLLEERLRKPDEEAWARWEDVRPVTVERIAALDGPCPDPAAR